MEVARPAFAPTAERRRMRKSEAMRMPKPRVGSAWKDLRSGQVWVMTGTRHNAPCLAKPGSKKSHRIAAHDLHMFYEPL